MQKSPRSSTATGTPGRVAGRRWPAVGLLAGLILVLGQFGVAAGALPDAQPQAAACSAGCASATDPAIQAVADPSPTPTLGSTESPNAMPPGDNDGDASDFSGAIWILPAVFILAGIAGTVYFLRQRSRNRES